MTFLILSDSHGRSDLVSEVLSLHKRCDGVIFLGDGIRDVSYSDCVENGGFYVGVRGNCDGIFQRIIDYEYSDELLLNLSEYTVIMMHGHLHGVKSGLDRAITYASKKGANVLLYGHTHLPFEKYYPEGTVINGYTLPRAMWAFNPGSLGSSTDGKHHYGIMGIRNGNILFSHGEVK